MIASRAYLQQEAPLRALRYHEHITGLIAYVCELPSLYGIVRLNNVKSLSTMTFKNGLIPYMPLKFGLNP